jgi:hypothetical protein
MMNMSTLKHDVVYKSLYFPSKLIREKSKHSTKRSLKLENDVIYF